MGIFTGEAVPTPNSELVGIWISNDATQVSNLITNYKIEKEVIMRNGKGYVKSKTGPHYKSCHGQLMEISENGNVFCIEMSGMWVKSAYSGPITNWNGPDGVWTGCCVGCLCCPKGMMFFNADIPLTDKLSQIIINEQTFTKGIPEDVNMEEILLEIEKIK